MDNEKVKNVARESIETEQLFKLFAERERNRRITDTSSFVRNYEKKGIHVKPAILRETLNKLEDLGIGEFVKTNKFKWRVPIKEVGGSVFGDTIDVKIKPAHTESMKTKEQAKKIQVDLSCKVSLPLDKLIELLMEEI